MEEVEKAYKEYEQAKDRAEQSCIIMIIAFDSIIQEQYNELKENFDEELKKLFLKNVKYMLSQIS